ncbi:MAG: OmpA family protein [Cyclobacteriaceae bacterium]|nr:OmpA family protein [Cyclobacteriaceae bacterium]
MGRLIFYILIWLLPTISFAQGSLGTSSKKAIKFYETGESYVKQRKFPEAIDQFNKAVASDNDFIEAHLRLAFCYELLRNTDDLQMHLEEVIRIAPNSVKYKNVYYSLARVYFNKGKYDQSGAMIATLEKLGIDNPRMQTDAEKMKENVAFAMENLQKPIDIHPAPMSALLNAHPFQYFPVLTADEQNIIYTVRMGSSFYDDENIVISARDSDGNWTNPVSISPNINSQFNEGTCTISADGRIIIFTTCEGRQGYGGCDLYISEKQGDEWGVPKNLGPGINSRSWESQPALSADGRKLYFVSDRAGGVGKRDIWVSEKDAQNIWQKARNLGTSINTSDEEVSPFIHVNGTTLFFASMGYPGFGGYDLYKSEKIDTVWSEPVNLGYPLNTYEDQVSLFVSANGKNGYYSYEKAEGGERRESLLYSFEFPGEGVLENKSIFITGNIYDANSKKPLKADIELFFLGENVPASVFTSDVKTGEYLTILNENNRFALYINCPGYLFESATFDLSTDQKVAIRHDFYLKPITIGNSVRLNNLFFDVNSAELSPESKTELNKVVRFLNDNPGVRIGIAGHTDDQGTEQYNQQLSQNRARAVYEYLIKEGIKPQSLTFAGYGESKPIVNNTDEESRRLNRRIEFIVEGL